MSTGRLSLILGVLILGSLAFSFTDSASKYVGVSTEASVAAAQTATVSNPQEIKILVLLTSFSNLPPSSEFDKATLFNNVFSSASGTVKTFIEKASYGRARITGSAEGWITIPHNVNGVCEMSIWMDEALVEAQKKGISVDGYTHIIYIFPNENFLARTGCSQGGAAFGGSPENVRRAYMNGINSETVLHELLHNLNAGGYMLAHGNSISCDTNTIKSFYLASCSDIEYGDPFDQLGWGSSAYSTTVKDPPLLNAPHRIAAGWLTADRVITASSSGTYTINTLNSATGKVAIKLKKPDSDPNNHETTNDHYYIEYHPTEYAAGKIVPGVTVRIWNGDGQYKTRFLDMTPNSCVPNPMNPTACSLQSDESDGFLADGKTFADHNNIKITQLSHTSTTATVRIDVSSITKPSSLTSDRTSYKGGETITVTWSNSGATTAKDWIGLVKSGGKWTDYTGSKAQMWFYTGGAKIGTKTIIAPNVTGVFQLAYFVNDGYNEAIRSAQIFTAEQTTYVYTDGFSGEYQSGSSIPVVWNEPFIGPNDKYRWVGIVKDGGPWIAGGQINEAWFWTDNAKTGRKNLVAPKTGGSYQVIYAKVENGKNIELARSGAFTVIGPPPVMQIISSAVSYIQGSTITGTWSNTEGARVNDWIALVPKGTQWKANVGYSNWVWAPTNTQTQGESGQTSGSVSFPANIPAGDYELVYYLAGQDASGNFTEKARSASFVVAAPPPAMSLVVSATSFARGGVITGTWSNADGAKVNDWIAVVPAGTHWKANVGYANWVWASTNNQTQGSSGQRSGPVSFTVNMPGGQYELVYYLGYKDANGNYIEKARSAPFMVLYPED